MDMWTDGLTGDSFSWPKDAESLQEDTKLVNIMGVCMIKMQ